MAETVRKILITNDDGIRSPRMKRLAEAAMAYGEVYVVAPDEQCSAKSQCITLHRPLTATLKEGWLEGVVAYAIDGTPADCVRCAPYLLGTHFDLVLSGINQGYNGGNAIQYSGTVAAAMEAASEGIQAMAFSEPYEGDCSVTEEYLDKILGDLIERPLPVNQIWNINFPDCGMEGLKGILEDRKSSLNFFYRDEFIPEEISKGVIRLSLNGIYQEIGEEGTDYKALMDGYISVGIVKNIG